MSTYVLTSTINDIAEMVWVLLLSGRQLAVELLSNGDRNSDVS